MITGLLLQFATILAALLKGLISLKLVSSQGTEFYGTYSQFTTVTMLFGAILSLQLDSATVRFAVGGQPRPLGGVISANLLCILGVGSLLFCACFFGGDILSSVVYNQQGMNFPMRLSAISSVLTAMQLIMLSGLQATTRFKSMAVMQIGQAAMQVVAIALALHFGRIATVMMALVVVDALTLAVGWWFLRKDMHHARPDWQYLRHALRFVAPLCGAFLLTWAIHSGGRFLLVHRWGLSAVGVYSATFTIASLAGSFNQPFVKVIYPVVAATADHEMQGRLIRLWLRRYAVCANYLFVILVGLGHLLLKTVSSADFFAGRWVMAGIAFGFICTGFTRLLSILLQAHDKTGTMMTTLAAGVIAGLGIAALGVGPWKANALALGYAVGFGLPLLLMWPAVPKAGLLPQRRSVFKFMLSLVATNAIAVLPLLWFEGRTLGQGVLLGLAYTLLYSVAAIQTQLISRRDLRQLQIWLQRRRKAKAAHG